MLGSKALILLAVVVFGLAACSYDKTKDMTLDEEAFIKIDFKSSYPGIFWISDWSKDESYPAGYRYKIMSSINRSEQVAELIVVLEEIDSVKTEMSRMSVKSSSLNSIGEEFAIGLAEEFDLEFEMQDLSSISDSKSFALETTKLGWDEFIID